MISQSEAREMEFQNTTPVPLTTEQKLQRAEDLLAIVNDIIEDVWNDNEYMVFADTFEDDEGRTLISLTKYKRIK